MSDSFHTLKIGLERPSRRKQALLDDCFRAYAEGFQALLDQKRLAIADLAAQKVCPPLSGLLRLFTPADRACLKLLGLEPLADSLIQDLAMMLRSHLSLCQHGQRSRYPLIRTSPEQWQQEAIVRLDAWTMQPPAARTSLATDLHRTAEAIGRIKSIYLGRHSEKRDFCLLYQPATGRFYAKIFLMNRQRAKAWQSQQSVSGHRASPDPLYHLNEAHSLLPLPTEKDRYLVFPLAMGQAQHTLLLAAWSDPSSLRSARLCRTRSGTDLHIHLRRPSAGADFGAPLHWIGLVRSSQASCALSICRQDGSLVRQELLDLAPDQVVATVRKLARQTHAQVIVPELAHHWDGLYREVADQVPVAAKLARKTWLDLVEKLKTSLSRAGLPLPVLISPYHIYQTCPKCQSKRKDNRSLPMLLVCTSCGFSQDISLAASHNLVAKYLSYPRERQNGQVHPGQPAS